MPMDRLETGIDQPTRHAPKTTHCGVYELEGLDIDNIYPRSLPMPDGWRAIYWYEDDVDLRIHFSDISTPSSPSTSCFARIWRGEVREDESHVDVDVSCGRIVLADDTSIRVLDYVERNWEEAVE
jgi:hypothetical protein